jgi:hypothetical protein
VDFSASPSPVGPQVVSITETPSRLSVLLSALSYGAAQSNVPLYSVAPNTQYGVGWDSSVVSSGRGGVQFVVTSLRSSGTFRTSGMA